MPRSISPGSLIAQRHQLHVVPRQRGPHCLHLPRASRILPAQDRHARDVRRNLLEQFEPFPGEAGFEIHDSRGVAARPRQSAEIPGPGRVGGVGEDDWHGAACHALQRRLQRDHCGSAAREEEVRPQRHQFLRVFAIPFGIAPRRAMLNLQVAPDGPAQSCHPPEEGGEPRLAFRIVSRQAS